MPWHFFAILAVTCPRLPEIGACGLAANNGASRSRATAGSWRRRAGCSRRRAASLCLVDYRRTLTARAITRPSSVSEMPDWAIMAILFQERSGMASVGLNAVALVKPR